MLTVLLALLSLLPAGSLRKALQRKAFRPSAKWPFQTTYVSTAQCLSPGVGACACAWQQHALSGVSVRQSHSALGAQTACCCMGLTPCHLRPTLLPCQRALLRTAQEIAKGMGYIHEFNIGGQALLFCLLA